MKFNKKSIQDYAYKYIADSNQDPTIYNIKNVLSNCVVEPRESMLDEIQETIIKLLEESIKTFNVIVRPFPKQNEPLLFTVEATNKREASIKVFDNNDNIKFILDVVEGKNFIWNSKVKNKYWNTYKSK